MKQNLLKTLFSIILLMVGVNVWADEETLCYSTATTTNMTGNNDAATLGMDAESWSVIGAKNKASNLPGLNKNGYIALYYNANGSNTITVTLNSGTINSINITYTEKAKSKGTITVGGALVDSVSSTSTTAKYNINATSFVIGNGNTSNVQVQIKSIVINYTDPNKCSRPTLSANSSFITTPYGVTITNNEEGGTVYYTTDGTTPTNKSTSFTSASNVINISETTTIKAITLKEGKTKSAVVTGEYTKVTPYDSFTAAKEVATTTATPSAFSFSSQVVTAANSANAFLQDKDGNVAIIYGSGHGFKKGQTISGDVFCSILLYNGVLEFTKLTKETEGIKTGTGNPVASTIDMGVLTADDYGKYINLKNVVCEDGVLKQGNNQITPDTRFTSASFENGATYNVSGIFVTVKTDDVIKFKIAPTNASDVTLLARKPTTLPLSFDGGKSELPEGMSQVDLGTDYKTSIKLKFDDTNDALSAHFNAVDYPCLQYNIKGNSFKDGLFDVLESADGVNFTTVKSYEALKDSINECYYLNPATQYVKFLYTKKVEGNVALGAINIFNGQFITTNEAGVASFYSEDVALDFASTEGLTAYVADEVTESSVHLKAVESVPSGTAFVVKGEPSRTYGVRDSDNPQSINTNEFLGTASAYTVAGNETIYALNSDGRFQKVATGVEVPAGKAVIRVSKSSAKDVLTLNFGDATAINAIQTVNTVNANAFNIAGQRVNSDAKGIVIVNGKKYIVR